MRKVAIAIVLSIAVLLALAPRPGHALCVTQNPRVCVEPCSVLAYAPHWVEVLFHCT